MLLTGAGMHESSPFCMVAGARMQINGEQPTTAWLVAGHPHDHQTQSADAVVRFYLAGFN